MTYKVLMLRHISSRLTRSTNNVSIDVDMNANNIVPAAATSNWLGDDANYHTPVTKLRVGIDVPNLNFTAAMDSNCGIECNLHLMSLISVVFFTIQSSFGSSPGRASIRHSRSGFPAFWREE